MLNLVTLFAVRTRDDVLNVRFAISPVWETSAAVRALIDDDRTAEHEPWHRIVGDRARELDLAPLFAVQPSKGFVPDFLTPPPATPAPRLRQQLAALRATPPDQVARELERSRLTVAQRYRDVLDRLLADPATARDLLADRLHAAWRELVAPFWPRIRTLLDRDLDRLSRAIARHGFRRALDDLHPQLRWTKRGLSCVDRNPQTVTLDERGLLLMPSAFLAGGIVAVVDPPWLPTIVYPARGLAGLWRSAPAPPDGLSRLLGRTRALVLAALDAPTSTTTLAAQLELSPAGVSRHLLALRDAGLVDSARHGHEVRYGRTSLGSALLAGRVPSG